MNEKSQKFFCFINHNNESCKVKFPPGLYEYITRTWYSGEVNMPPYSVALLGPHEEARIVEQK